MRSAAPPTIVGTYGPNACITCAADLRVEIAPFSGSNTGSASANPARGLPAHASRHSPAASGFADGPRLEPLLPLGLGRSPAEPLVEMGGDLVRHQELRVRIPAERLLRLPHLLVGHRVAVGVPGARARRAVADHRAQADQRRPRLLGHAGADRSLDRVEVVAVLDRERVPAVGARSASGRPPGRTRGRSGRRS